MKAPLYIITGAMAAGKSTVAKALVQRFDRSAHVSGDAILRMIMSGGASLGPVLGTEGRRQLTLRQDIGMDIARSFVGAGFTTVYQDILIGSDLVRVAASMSDLAPRIVVLNPDAEALGERDLKRPKTGYSEKFRPEFLAQALRSETPSIGLWIDTSRMSVEHVIEAVMANW